MEARADHGAWRVRGNGRHPTSANDYSKWVACLLSAWPPRDGADSGRVRRSSVRELAQGANFSPVRPRPGTSGAEAAVKRQRTRWASSRPPTAILDHIKSRRWLPGYGSHVLLLARLRHRNLRAGQSHLPGPRPPVWDSAVTLLRPGRLRPPSQTPSSALTTAYTGAAKMFTSGSVASAGDVLAMNS